MKNHWSISWTPRTERQLDFQNRTTLCSSGEFLFRVSCICLPNYRLLFYVPLSSSETWLPTALLFYLKQSYSPHPLLFLSQLEKFQARDQVAKLDDQFHRASTRTINHVSVLPRKLCVAGRTKQGILVKTSISSLIAKQLRQIS